MALIFSLGIAVPLLTGNVTVGQGTGNVTVGQGIPQIVAMFTITAIGLSLGGTTGYALNPARDLGTRVIYTIFHRKV
jgi:glycerol uptake facilitator protein